MGARLHAWAVALLGCRGETVPPRVDAAALDAAVDRDADVAPPDDHASVADAGADGVRCAIPPGADPRVREAVPAAGWRCIRYPVPLGAPRDVLETRDGVLLITEQNTGRVVRFDTRGVTPVVSGLSAPIGLRETVDGTLFVTEEGAQSLSRIDRAAGTFTRVASGLSAVTYLEIVGRTAWVSSFPSFVDPGVVHRVDLAVDPPRTTSFATGFFVTEGLAATPSGSLVVAEWGGAGSAGPGRLTEVAAAGGARSAGREIVTGLQNVYGIYRGPGGGYLVAAGTRVVHVHDDGTTADLLTDVQVPTGITITRDGAVLVLEHLDVNHDATGYLLRLTR